MWNAPIRRSWLYAQKVQAEGKELPPEMTGLQVTPRTILGFLDYMELELQMHKDHAKDSPAFVQPPYDRLPPRVLLLTAIKVMDALVSTKPLPAGGHNALEEAVLYGLCQQAFQAGKDLEEEAAKDPQLQEMFITDHLNQVNAIRRLADEPPVGSLAALEEDAWEETLDSSLFWDRDWEMSDPASLQKLQDPEALRELGIDAEYFGTILKEPDEKSWREACAKFAHIHAWAVKTDLPLPDTYRHLDDERLSRYTSPSNYPSRKPEPPTPPAPEPDL